MLQERGGHGIFLFCCLSVFLSCLIPSPVSAATLPDSTQRPIVEQALVFVELLDQRKPLKAWARTTNYFRKKFPPQRWQRVFRNQRQRFGRTVDRRLDGYRFYSSFEQAVDGLYLQVRFRTDFEARDAVLERVEMFKDYDGRWRVIGYFMDLE